MVKPRCLNALALLLLSPLVWAEPQYGPVVHGETLWSIAQKIRVSHSMPFTELLAWLHAHNPQAFVDNDINRLRVGAWLTLPPGAADTARALVTAAEDSAGVAARAKSAATAAEPTAAAPPSTVPHAEPPMAERAARDAETTAVLDEPATAPVPSAAAPDSAAAEQMSANGAVGTRPATAPAPTAVATPAPAEPTAAALPSTVPHAEPPMAERAARDAETTAVLDEPATAPVPSAAALDFAAAEQIPANGVAAVRQERASMPAAAEIDAAADDRALVGADTVSPPPEETSAQIATAPAADMAQTTASDPVVQSAAEQSTPETEAARPAGAEREQSASPVAAAAQAATAAAEPSAPAGLPFGLGVTLAALLLALAGAGAYLLWRRARATPEVAPQPEHSVAELVARAERERANGHFNLARSALRQAIAQQPQDPALRLHLLEVEFAQNDAASFAADAEALLALLGSRTAPLWQQVEIMGQKLCPHLPPFRPEASS